MVFQGFIIYYGLTLSYKTVVFHPKFIPLSICQYMKNIDSKGSIRGGGVVQ